MAAEAVLPYVLSKLGDLLIQEAVFLHGATDQVKWLQHELRWMQGFLKDADQKKLVHEGVKNWVMEVRDVAYDAEDAVETFIHTIATQREEESLRKEGWLDVLQRCACFVRKLPARRRIGMEVEGIKLKINSISESRARYGIKDLDEVGEGINHVNQSLQRKRQFYAHLGEPDVVGFREDVKILVNQLIMGESRRCVVSVVGIGGSGKTTIAKKIYNCNQVKDHFEFRSLIYVSQDCRLRELFHVIIKCFTKIDEEIEKMNEPELAKRICDYLKHRRYLIVIDDIWRKENWDLLVYAIPDETNGSRVMLTTRIEGVSLHADPATRPYKLRLLNETESWNLFLKKVFVNEDNGMSFPPMLENFGKQIVKKCGGLPLAIVVLGGLLSTMPKTERTWLNVLQHINQHLSDGEDSCSQILALSYSELPYSLKPCFLYLGLFPEDSDISVEKVVRLWVGEGLIHGNKDELEDIGETYLEELIDRNMIQVVRRRQFDSSLVSCRIHDLMRDLCIAKAKENRFFEVYEDDMVTNAPQSMIRRTTEKTGVRIPDARHLRSFLCKTGSDLYSLPFKLEDAKLLRILDTPSIDIRSEISELVHLRYLSMHVGHDISLSLSNLCILQFLHLNGGTWRGAISQNMKHLRHLMLEDMECDLNVEDLSNLQTLSLNRCKGSVTGLQMVTKLRQLFAKWDRHINFCDTGLSLQNHRKLYTVIVDRLFKLPHDPHKLPPNLVELSFMQTELEADMVLPILGKLPNLLKLELRVSAVRNKIVLSRGGFPRLQVLKFQDLDVLECHVEKGAMPALQRLKIDGGTLQMLPEGLQHLITLKELRLKDAYFIHRLRENNGEDWYKIRDVPSIVIESSEDSIDPEVRKNKNVRIASEPRSSAGPSTI